MRVLIAISHLPHVAAVKPHDVRDAAIDGELVTPVLLECADDHCDTCRAAWFGLSTHRSTTSAMIVDRPHLTEGQVRHLVHEWLDCQGTIDLVDQAVAAGEFEVCGQVVSDTVVAVDDLISDHLEEMRTICEAFPVGTVLSRLGQLVSPQARPVAA